jgi:hypothetical protein
MPVETKSQVDALPFNVVPVHPSGIPQISDGKVSVVRQFQVEWENVEELMLRVLGKFYEAGVTEFPVLPAKYPSNNYSLYATSVSVDMSKSSACSFNNDSEESTPAPIDDLESIQKMEKYYYANPEFDDKNDEFLAVVSVTYTEAEWDCTEATVGGLLPNTGVRTEINPSYEVYTLPSRMLFFSDMTQSDDVDNGLKDDTKAYTIIPKEDVIVHWSNVPTEALCKIYDHLAKYRGKVNTSVFGAIFYCGEQQSGSGSSAGGCEFYPAETLMFVDYEEDFSRRTQGFGEAYMNTTTLKLHFKVKHITVLDEAGEIIENHGWNHMPFDHSGAGADIDRWGRVKVRVGSDEKDLFEKTDFTDIMNPPVYDEPT